MATTTTDAQATPTAVRVYRVGEKLIKAHNLTQAVRHHAKSITPMRLATAEDLIGMTKAGIEVEDSRAPEAEATPEGGSTEAPAHVPV